MKTGNEKSDIDVNVDALLAAINEISESEVRRTDDNSDRVIVNGRDYHTYRELAEAFELDIHDFSVSEANRQGEKNPGHGDDRDQNLLMQEALENSLHQEI